MWADLILALRQLKNAPRFVLLAVTTLSLAIGANSAVFSIADAVLFRPLPYANPERVYILRMLNPKTGKYSPLVPFQYLEAVARATCVESVSGHGMLRDASERGRDGVDVVRALTVAPDYFDVLGVRPRFGRLFNAKDADERRAIVLTYAGWQQRYNADRNVVGRSFNIAGERLDVVGVLPRGFVFPVEPVTASWDPAGRAACDYVKVAPVHALVPGRNVIDPIVRLRAGDTVTRAQAEIANLVRSVDMPGPRRDVVPQLVDVRSVLFPTGRAVMRLLVVASGVVLLLGCVNLTHLLLTRNHTRARDFAVKAALGASRLQLVRPIFLEAFVIGAAAAGVALIVTSLAFDSIRRQVPAVAYGDAPVGVDWRVGLYALALGVLSGVCIAAMTASRVMGSDVRAGVAGDGRGLMAGTKGVGTGVGRVIMVVQVAVATVLVSGAIVATRNLASVLLIPLGFSHQDVFTIAVDPPGSDARSVRTFYLGAVEELRRRPGVLAAGATDSVPLAGTVTGGGEDDVLATDGETIPTAAVLPGLFETIGIRLLRGRTFSLSDAAHELPFAVVNESAARTLFRGRTFEGWTLRTKGGRELEVVGVVGDVRMRLNSHPSPMVYAIPGNRFGRLSVLVRMRPGSDNAATEIRRQVGLLAPESPVTVFRWTESIDAMAGFRTPRFQALVLGTFAALAIALSVLGVFGVVSFFLATRRHELGVRMALGATRASLTGVTMRYTLVPVVIGVVGGSGASWAVGRVAEAQLFGFSGGNTLVFVIGGSTALITALLSAYIPARRASRLNPAILLRTE